VTCQQLRELLVDRARGVRVGAGRQAALESHLEICSDCAVEDARQLALTEALRAVARTASHLAAPAALERRLVDAFVAQRMESSAPVVPARRFLTRRWLATAAAVVLFAGGFYGVLVRLKPDATPEVRLNPDTTPELRLKPDATSEVRLKPDTTTDVRLKPDTITRVRNPQAAKVSQRPSVRLQDFMALPGATSLPAFESGRIIRVDLPVSSLPAYGVELVPDAARTEVQADVLVGQDGQARAIRLVNSSSDAGGGKPQRP
jgi:hypothetical protein